MALLTGFVEPATGATVWNISNAVSKPLFELVLTDFVASVSTGEAKRIGLKLDNADWQGPGEPRCPRRRPPQPSRSGFQQPDTHSVAATPDPRSR
jgi:hypothetical protein